MSQPIEFLEAREVLVLHAWLIDRFGGEDGVRDLGLLESAIAQPCAGMDGQYFHDDLFEMAAAYAFHIAQNQPFVDGNKRTGLLAALTFLDMNDHPINQSDDRLFEAMLGIADRSMGKSDLVDLFKSLAMP